MTTGLVSQFEMNLSGELESLYQEAIGAQQAVRLPIQPEDHEESRHARCARTETDSTARHTSFSRAFALFMGLFGAFSFSALRVRLS